ncbi:MAG: hypothetical protein GWP06_01775 [Actinobacteria bacterium]|nr:hypothetical protein [Actinomycetota bacterium]
MACCTDTTSRIVVRLNLDEVLLDYDYSKITCGREINGNSRLKKYLTGKPIKSIVAASFSQIGAALRFDEDEQFLAWLEWDALQNAILQYTGIESDRYSDRYKLAAIIHEKNFIEIRQIILPLGASAINRVTLT